MPSRPLLSWPPALVLLALLASPARADVTVGGHVYDLASGDGLPQASVQVVDRYHGTIANDDGDFVLIVDHLPVISGIEAIIESGPVAMAK